MSTAAGFGGRVERTTRAQKLVFAFCDPADLLACDQVCREWNRTISLDNDFWHSLIHNPAHEMALFASWYVNFAASLPPTPC